MYAINGEQIVVVL